MDHHFDLFCSKVISNLLDQEHIEKSYQGIYDGD